MGHLKTGETRAEATPTEWLRAGRTIGELANKWSMRDDIVAYVGPGAGGEAPACFSPTTAEVEVNVDIAFGFGVKPEEVERLKERKAQYEFPKGTGAIMHEAFHARFSRWSMPQAHAELKSDEYQALVLLEESRIEYQGLKSMPNARPFLRACAMEIVIGDIKEDMEKQTATKSLTNLIGLVHARIDAGILEEHEVAVVMDMVADQIPANVIEQLRTIAVSAQAHESHKDATDLYPLAIEWARIVRELAKERGDEEGNNSGMGEALKKIMSDVLDAMKEASEEVSANNFGDLADQEQNEDMKEEVKGKANDAKEQHENRDIASEVFSKSSGAGSTKSNSKLLDVRSPNTDELIAAVTIGQWLEKAKYRERDEHEIASVLPPGRLRTRAIVQNEALKSRGVNQRVEAFRRTVRKHTDDPTLHVGVMVDISGSMGSAMQPMATTAWVMAEAVNRIQGECAMVYFGNDVFPTLKAGQRLKDVSVYSAPDGTEKFGKAFSALDGALNLIHGNGARLLVVVSDGEYTSDESRKALEVVAKCKEAGVAILWLPFDNGSGASRLAGDHAEVVRGISNPAEAAETIGRAAERVMTRIGQRVA
jgi:hypothetical protein